MAVLDANLTAKVGENFAFDLNTVITDAEKHNFSLAVSSLPSGVSLNGAVISGTPGSSGNYSFTVTATDEKGARAQFTLSLNVAAEGKKSGGSLGWAWFALLGLVGVRRLAAKA